MEPNLLESRSRNKQFWHQLQVFIAELGERRILIFSPFHTISFPFKSYLLRYNFDISQIHNLIRFKKYRCFNIFRSRQYRTGAWKGAEKEGGRGSATLIFWFYSVTKLKVHFENKIKTFSFKQCRRYWPMRKTFDLVATLFASHVRCPCDQILHLKLLSVISF